jgi:septal ring factor EnvC (AmiA/AmiB activator)
MIFFFLLWSFSYGDQLEDMKRKVGDIERGIENSNQQITTIGENRDTLRNQIKSIELDLKKIEIEKKVLLQKISILSKKIDYSKSSLKFSSSEFEIKTREYNAKLEAWHRAKKSRQEKEYENKRNFKELLYSDLESLEHIRMVQKDIDLVKNDIENDRKEQSKLKNLLASKERLVESKKREKDSLIARLNKEEVYHKKKITSLETEKKNIQNQIEKIIIERARQVKNVSLSTAKSKIGTMKKPIAGSYSVSFGEKKQGNIVSTGVEIASKLGNRVRASASGKVIYADKFQGLGKVIMIDYGYNMIGIYGNLITNHVKVGEIVKIQQDIGILGLSTDGKSNLYYELRFKLEAINPITMF